MDCSGGSDWESIRVLRVNETGGVTYLNDTLNNVKFSSTAWSPDNKVCQQHSRETKGTSNCAVVILLAESMAQSE